MPMIQNDVYIIRKQTCSGKHHGKQKHAPGTVRLCRGCSFCPKCEGFKLLKGDYCDKCTISLINRGYIWSDYYDDYVKPSEVNKDILERERKHVKPVQGDLFAAQRVLL